MYIAGIPQFHDLPEVVSNSVRICRSTHADRRCVTSAVMVSVIIALLLQVRKNTDTVKLGFSGHCFGCSPRFRGHHAFLVAPPQRAE